MVGRIVFSKVYIVVSLLQYCNRTSSFISCVGIITDTYLYGIFQLNYVFAIKVNEILTTKVC